MKEAMEAIQSLTTEEKDTILFDIFITHMKAKTVLSNEEKLKEIESSLRPIAGKMIF